MRPQIEHIQSKLSRSISVLAQADHALNQKSIHILNCSLQLSYLNSYSEVWGKDRSTTIVHPAKKSNENHP